MYIGPITSIEISGMSDIVDGRRKVTIAATGRAIWLPASLLIFEHRRVIMPLWLYKKYERYFCCPTQTGKCRA